jgi:hypothetical protein
LQRRTVGRKRTGICGVLLRLGHVWSGLNGLAAGHLIGFHVQFGLRFWLILNRVWFDGPDQESRHTGMRRK